MKECMNNDHYSRMRLFFAWAVHAFTASGSFLGLWSLYKIYQHDYIQAFWLMAITIFIDAVDGALARKVEVKRVLPNIDGALLDNIVDYLNYVITPCFFLLVKTDMLPSEYALWIVAAITLTSAYQFCQSDAKTPDHFFKGFPCYWNFTVFYMFLFSSSAMTNALILFILCIMIFVPIKYVYPSRIDYLTKSKQLKTLMHVCSISFGVSSSILLASYPTIPSFCLWLSIGYVILYLTLSIYRTCTPTLIDCIQD